MNISKIFKKKRTVSLKIGKYNLVNEIPIATKSHNINNEFYFSIASIVKNEGPYLEEWIEFHRLVGCEHFIIYNNDSTDDTVKILQKYVQSNIVTLVPWPRFCPTHNLQMLAYSHALTLMRGRTYWLSFIDLDEFLFPTETDDIRTALFEFESEPAVGVYWSLFGASGHKSKPQGLVIENYTWRMPYPMEKVSAPNLELLHKEIGGLNFKSIVQPARVVGTIDPHAFRTDRFPVLAVGGNWKEIQFKTKKFLNGKFQLNHYISKSKEEFEARLGRQNVIGIDKSERKTRLIKAIEADPVEDTEIFKYLPELKCKVKT